MGWVCVRQGHTYISSRSHTHTFSPPVKLNFDFLQGKTAGCVPSRGACVYLSVDQYPARMHQLLVVTWVLVALCSLRGADSSAYDKIVSHSRIRARNEG